MYTPAISAQNAQNAQNVVPVMNIICARTYNKPIVPRETKQGEIKWKKWTQDKN